MSYSERLRPPSMTVSEYLDGSVPPIEYFTLSFSERLEGLTGAERAKHAVELAESRLDEIQYNFTSHETGLKNPPKDLLTVLYLQCISYYGRHILNEKEKKAPKIRYGGNDFETFKDMMIARQRLQESIGDIEAAFVGAGDYQIYEAVEALAYDANCLLVDSEDLEHYEDPTRGGLSGILAEHKVLRALKNKGWRLAHYASYDLDAHFKTDIVVPVNGHHKNGSICIQVKALPKHSDKFSARYLEQENVMEVGVPMSKRWHSQIRLADEDAEKLHTCVDMYASEVSPHAAYSRSV